MVIGWCVFWLLGIAGTYPLSNAREILVNRTAMTVYESGAAVLLWLLCRRLLERERPWRAQAAIAGAAAYLLGYTCYVLADITTTAIRFSGRSGGFHWRGAMRTGVMGASIYSFPLVAWTGIYLAIGYWQVTREREKQLLRAETLAREAELRALRLELTPHFLFNTLNGISTLVGENKPQEARRMIARLGDFLRSVLQEAGHHDISLDLELRHIEDYLAIEQIRLGDRLRLRLEVDPEARDVRVPNMILQPLVENAIRHGIAPNPDGGELWIRACRAGGLVRISFENTICAERSNPAAGTSNGFGLKNTSDRLAARYGKAFRFQAGAEQEGRWQVTLEIPWETRGHDTGADRR